jgi:hypothetical protein
MHSCFREDDDEKAQFLAHFGAGFLVWFVYLPVLGVIASQISQLWRFKIILGEGGFLYCPQLLAF